jgi:ABC-type uncharacterized transport system substrate-binding protein
MKPEDKAVVQQLCDALKKAGITVDSFSVQRQVNEALDAGKALLEQPDAWVGLTEEERRTLFNPLHDVPFEFARAIEAKLKEKNT